MTEKDDQKTLTQEFNRFDLDFVENYMGKEQVIDEKFNLQIQKIAD